MEFLLADGLLLLPAPHPGVDEHIEFAIPGAEPGGVLLFVELARRLEGVEVLGGFPGAFPLEAGVTLPDGGVLLDTVASPVCLQTGKFPGEDLDERLVLGPPGGVD